MGNLVQKGSELALECNEDRMFPDDSRHILERLALVLWVGGIHASDIPGRGMSDPLKQEFEGKGQRPHRMAGTSASASTKGNHAR